jgi:acetyl-CoA carboxylase alpha subunit
MEEALSNEKRLPVKKKKFADIYTFLEAYIAKREQQIAEIMQLVERFEKKRLAEERSYQSVSPLRRIFSAKKPDQRVALEYVHHVKKPLEQVKRLRAEIEEVRAMLRKSQAGEPVELTDDIERELL